MGRKVRYMKDILTKLFGKNSANKENHEDFVGIIPKALYNVGWDINISGYKKITNEWQRVYDKDLEKVKELLTNQVAEMHKAIEEAHNQKKEFVNLHNNILKLSDVSSITSYCYKM